MLTPSLQHAKSKIVASRRISVARAPVVARGMILGARCQLRRTHTRVKSIADIIGTTRVWSERQGEVITIQMPQRPAVNGHANTSTVRHQFQQPLASARLRLSPATTKVKTIADRIGTNRVWSERQGRVITLQQPVIQPEEFMASQKAQWKQAPRVSGSDLLIARSQLRQVSSRVKSVVDLIGTNRVFSERQGKAITLLQPLLPAKPLAEVCPQPEAESPKPPICPSDTTKPAPPVAAVLAALVTLVKPAFDPCKPSPAQQLLAKHQGNLHSAAAELLQVASS